MPLLGNHQIVGDREHSGNAVGAEVDDVLVGQAVDHSLERDVPVLHNDTDGLEDGQSIALQRRIPLPDGLDAPQYALVNQGISGLRIGDDKNACQEAVLAGEGKGTPFSLAQFGTLTN